MRILSLTIKMTCVGIIVSLIASLLSLEYAITAGIVGVLSISLTKKDTIYTAFRRSIDAILGLMLSSLMFLAFGYHFWVFGIFMFFFIYLSFQLKIHEGIVLSLVLVSHLLTHGTFDMGMIANELAILFIAVGVALIFNVIYPQFSDKALKKHVEFMDQLIRDHLFMLSILLKDPEYHDEYYQHYLVLDRKISYTIDEVTLVDKDLLFSNDHAYLAYFQMRKEQATYIRHMYLHALKLLRPHPFTHEIAEFIKVLSFDIGLYDKATKQSLKLKDLRDHYKLSNLPQTREEFELRASLYQLLNEIQSFLDIKISFHHEYPYFGEKQKKASFTPRS